MTVGGGWCWLALVRALVSVDRCWLVLIECDGLWLDLLLFVGGWLAGGGWQGFVLLYVGWVS